MNKLAKTEITIFDEWPLWPYAIAIAIAVTVFVAFFKWLDYQ